MDTAADPLQLRLDRDRSIRSRPSSSKRLRRRLRRLQRHPDDIVINPSLLAQLHILLAVLVTTVMAIYLAVSFDWGSQTLTLGQVLKHELRITLPLFGIVPLVLLGTLSHRLLDRRYLLCNDYILEVEGLLAWKLRTVRLRYLHIRGLEVDRTILQHLFNVGDLRVGGEISPEDTDIVMTGIYKPERYKDIIKERINQKVTALGLSENRRLGMG